MFCDTLLIDIYFGVLDLIDEKTRRQKRRNYIVLAEKSYLDDDIKRSLSFYKKSLGFSSKEEYINSLFNIALIYDELELFSESMRTYKEILSLDIDNPGAYYGVAIMEEQLGNLDKALEYFFKAIEKDGHYDRAYYFAANIYDLKGEKLEAIKLYKKVIDLKPDDYHAYNNLGSYMRKWESTMKPIKCSRRA